MVYERGSHSHVSGLDVVIDGEGIQEGHVEVPHVVGSAHFPCPVSASLCVCVCVCVCEREREREKERVCVC